MNRRISQTKFVGVRYREDSDKRFQGRADRYYFIRYQKGKQVEEGVGWTSEGMTPQQASNIRGEIVANIRTGSGPMSLKEKRETELGKRESKARENLPFNTLVADYLDWAKSNKASWKDDRTRYNKHIKPVFGNKLIKNISPLDLEKLKRTLQKKELAPATIKQCLVLVRQMFNKATAWGKFSGDNPFKKATLNNRKLLEVPDNRRVRFLQPEQANSLLNVLANKSPQVHDMALLSLDTGMRKGEVFSLTWQDIDFKNEIIQIKDTKNNRNRQSFMTKEVKAMLKTIQRSGSGVGHIFQKKNGGSINHVYKVFDRTVEALGFNKGIKDRRDKVVFHTLRHTFASWLASNGTPLLVIKELGGWQSLDMVERYTHLVPDEKRKAIKNLERKKVLDGNAYEVTTS
jgi:integrase